MIRRTLLLTALALGVASTLAAQGAPPTPRRAGPPDDARRAMPMAGLRERLGLTDAQLSQMEALRAAERARPSREPDMLRARADLMQAMQGEGDLAAARRAMEKMNSLRTEQALQRLESRQKMRAILTAEQRTTFDAMQGRRGGMRGLRGVRDHRGRMGMMGGGHGGRGGRGMGIMGMPGFGPPGWPRGMMMGPPPAMRGAPDAPPMRQMRPRRAMPPAAPGDSLD
ncbi:MAG: Spy/CpxP family protein refolding chaperone [Gemmatimonadaceae bacterium]|nr:Spy/CpxP family protein refolding chaperone [Gemmatimonadaceae bacterium]